MLCVYLFSYQFNLKEIMLNIDLGNSPLRCKLYVKFDDKMPYLRTHEKTGGFGPRLDTEMLELRLEFKILIFIP